MVKNIKKNSILITLVIVFGIISGILVSGFNKKTFQPLNRSPVQPKGGQMKITSVFENNGQIPSKYTCDGQDLAPELTISDIPTGTKELVLIVDDPDAPVGTFVHWVLYNIPANTAKIDEKNLPQGVKQGFSDFRRNGWGGPCPPNGEHRYFFKLYAINKTLDLPEGASKSKVENAIKGHVIEQVQLIGLYKRK